MDHHILVEMEITACLLFKPPRRVRHVQATTPVADRHAVREDVLAESDRHRGIKRLHRSIAKDIPAMTSGWPGTKDQIAVGMDPGPIKRHEAALVSKRVEIVGEPAVEVFATQVTRTSHDIWRQHPQTRARQ